MFFAPAKVEIYNTTLIKKGEITNYKDLLKPQYKGKIIMIDPTTTGSGNTAISSLALNSWGQAETAEFLRRLVKEQQVVITRDKRIHIESVARGKYAIGFGPNQGLLAQFLREGAPIDIALVEEDNRVITGNAGLGVPTKFAHPNAATVFVNWLLTKEGQTLYSEGWGAPSTRIDASKEGFNPLFFPVSGKKYYYDTVEQLEANGKWLTLSRKIIDEATK